MKESVEGILRYIEGEGYSLKTQGEPGSLIKLFQKFLYSKIRLTLEVIE